MAFGSVLAADEGPAGGPPACRAPVTCTGMTTAAPTARRPRATRAELDEALAHADQVEDDAFRLAHALAAQARLWADPAADRRQARLAALRALAEYDDTDPMATGLRCDTCGGPYVWRGNGLPTCARHGWNPPSPG